MILSTVIFRITHWDWNAPLAVQLRSQPYLTALATWIESIATWNKVITETQTGYTRVLLSNKNSFGCPNICASFRNYLHLSCCCGWRHLYGLSWAVMLCAVYLFSCSQCNISSFYPYLLSLVPCDGWNTKVPYSNMEGPHNFLNLLIKVAVLKLNCLFLGFLRLYFLYKTFENLLLKLWEMFKIIFAMCNFYKN